MRVIGKFTVPAAHPSLPGHFPGNPVVPGVVLLDEAAALILLAEPGQALAGFPSVRFTRPVRAEESVIVCYEAGRFQCRVGEASVLAGTVALQSAPPG